MSIQSIRYLDIVQNLVVDYVGDDPVLPKYPVPFQALLEHFEESAACDSTDQKYLAYLRDNLVPEEEDLKVADEIPVPGKGSYDPDLGIPVTFNSKQYLILSDPKQDKCVKKIIAYLKDHPESIGKALSHDGQGLKGSDVFSYGITAFYSSLAYLIFHPPRYEGEYWIKNPSYDPMDEASPIWVKIIPLGAKYLSGPSFAGAALWAGSATLVHAGKVAWKNIRILLNSPEYLVWSRLRDQILINDSVKEFISQDPMISKYKCPIKKMIPAYPVTHKSLTYEAEAIHDWLDKNPGKKYPLEDSVFTEQDLKYDWGHANTVRDRLIQMRATMRTTSSIYNAPGFGSVYDTMSRMMLETEKRESDFIIQARIEFEQNFQGDKASAQYYIELGAFLQRCDQFKSTRKVVTIVTEPQTLLQRLFRMKPTQQTFISRT